jgi:WS/DGAT/MGAT family acyltransferase
MSDVKAVRLKWGGTFNDVVLAAITSAFRELLRKRGESAELPIRSLVPVSVRPRDERGLAVDDGTLANRVSAVIADLPVQVADPVERLRSISDQMAALKDSRQAMAVEALTQLGSFAPPVLLSLACRLGGKLSQRSINTVTTNVPGPQVPLYAAGRRMLEVFPYVPLAVQIRMGVAIFSYNGNVSFGVTGDYGSTADIDVLVQGINSGMTELLATP